MPISDKKHETRLKSIIVDDTDPNPLIEYSIDIGMQGILIRLRNFFINQQC